MTRRIRDVLGFVAIGLFGWSTGHALIDEPLSIGIAFVGSILLFAIWVYFKVGEQR